MAAQNEHVQNQQEQEKYSGHNGQSIYTQQLDTVCWKQESSNEQIYLALLRWLEREHRNKSGAIEMIQVRNDESQNKQQ